MIKLDTSLFKGWPSKDCKPLLNLVLEPEQVISRYQLNFVREKDDLDWHQAAHFYDSELGPVVFIRYDNSPMSGCGIYIDSGADIHLATERLIAVLKLDKRDINWSVVDT